MLAGGPCAVADKAEGPMKPRFALVLSLEQVALLHRQKRGWEELGGVPLDDPDFGGRLAALREAALALSPDGIETKLVLPESQVLYTAIASPGREDKVRRDAIRRALEGMTPYAVDDLAFDYEAEGEVLHVAVVARETLDEAEDFAAGHRLNPVSIVARPRGGSFTGEPFFGETAAAAAILRPGERVERDVLPTLATLKLVRPVMAPEADPGGMVHGVAAALPETAAAPEETGDATPAEADPGAGEAVAPSAAGSDSAAETMAAAPTDAPPAIDAGAFLSAEEHEAGAAAASAPAHPAAEPVTPVPADPAPAPAGHPPDAGTVVEEHTDDASVVADAVSAGDTADDATPAAGPDASSGPGAEILIGGESAPDASAVAAEAEAGPGATLEAPVTPPWSREGVDATRDVSPRDHAAETVSVAEAGPVADGSAQPVASADAVPAGAVAGGLAETVADGLGADGADAGLEQAARPAEPLVVEAPVAYRADKMDAAEERHAAPVESDASQPVEEAPFIEVAEEPDEVEALPVVAAGSAARDGLDAIPPEEPSEWGPTHDDRASARPGEGSGQGRQRLMAEDPEAGELLQSGEGLAADAPERGVAPEGAAQADRVEDRAAEPPARAAFASPEGGQDRHVTAAAPASGDEEISDVAPAMPGLAASASGAADPGRPMPPPPRGPVPLPGALKVGVTSGELPPAIPPAIPLARPVAHPMAGSRTAKARAAALAQAPASLRKVLARPRPMAAPEAASAGGPAQPGPPRRGPASRRSPLMAFVLTTGLVAVIAAVALWSALFNPAGPVPGQAGPEDLAAAMPRDAVPPAATVAPLTADNAVTAPPDEVAGLAPPPPVEAAPDAGTSDPQVALAPADLPAAPGMAQPEPGLTAAPGSDAGVPDSLSVAAAADGSGAGAATSGAATAAAAATVGAAAAAIAAADPAKTAVADAATGIWAEAPEAPDPLAEAGAAATVRGAADPRLPEETPDELTPDGMAADPAPPPPVPAPPPGAVIAFGPDGLVVPTPAGTPTPEGIVVTLGRPALVPPGRAVSQAAAAPAEAGDAAAAAAPDAVADAPSAADQVPAAPMLELGGADAPAGTAPLPAEAAEAGPFALPGVPSTPPRARPAAFLAAAAEATAAPLPEAEPAGAAADGLAQPLPAEPDPLAGFRPRPRPFAAPPPAADSDASLRPAVAGNAVAATGQPEAALGAGGAGTPTAAAAAAEASSAPAAAGSAGDLVAAALPRPAADPALAGFRPQARTGTVLPAAAPPGGAAEAAAVVTEVAAQLPAPVSDPALAGFRPRLRPEALVAAAAPVAAGVAAATAEPEAAPPASFPGATDLAVAVAPVPRGRPQDFAERAQIAAAAAAAARAVASAPPPPEPPPAAAPAAAPPAATSPSTQTAEADPEAEADGEVEVAAVAAAPAGGPRLPTRASVAEQATVENAIRLNRVNLIGIYGGARDRRALVRLPSGRYVKVQVGDRVDGGRVAAISERELQLVKGGRNIVLRVGEGG
jgi:hypothetical protein